MSRPTSAPQPQPETAQGSVGSYVLGFALSLAFTLTAYALAANHALPSRTLVTVVLGLGVMQLIVQLALFLHLGKGSKPQWNVSVFSFALLVIVILVGGSLWIMTNLNYHMISPTDTDRAIIHDEGVGP
ncbi:MAG TPA: cytochrome o ubiquinol oxidase subunit IV [Candidatus Saccharimonadia bacterium]|nr:cytochrome o ubiquinol oxidase subunit IV [Candidatus Saccharimonadia bacterium]